MADSKDRNQSLGSTVARGTSVGFLGALLAQVILFGSYVILARLASPEIFGAFAAASILVAVGGLFIESGMTAALIQRRDRIEEAMATAFAATLASGIGLALLSAALAPGVGWLFGGQEMVAEIALALAGIHILNGLHVVPNALLQREFAYVRKATIEPISLTTYGAVGAVGLAIGWGVWALVGALYASGVVRLLLAWALTPRRPDPRLATLGMWRELARYARHVVASEFLRLSGETAQTVLIGRVLSTTALAQFNFGNRIATQAASPISMASAYVLFPALARMSNDATRLRSAFQRSLSTLTYATAPLSLAFLPFGQAFVILLLGRTWQTAGDVLTSLCLVGVALALISISSEVFKAVGRPDLLPRMHLLTAVMGVGAVTLGVQFGVVAVGASLSVGTACVACYGLAAACSVTGLSIRACLDAVLRPVACAAAIACLFVPVERLVVEAGSRSTGTGILLLALEALAAGGLYLVVMSLLAPAATSQARTAAKHLKARRSVETVGDPVR